MNTLHTKASGPLALAVPVTSAVGRVEWVETQTRLYGVDSIGTVFVFKPPFTTPRHRSMRRRGLLAGAFRAFRFAGFRW